MTFAEPEGHPVSLDTCGHYLVVATDVGVLRVYDLSRREAKAHTNPKNLADVVPGFGSVVGAKVCCNGSRVSIMVKAVSVSLCRSCLLFVSESVLCIQCWKFCALKLLFFLSFLTNGCRYMY